MQLILKKKHRINIIAIISDFDRGTLKFDRGFVCHSQILDHGMLWMLYQHFQVTFIKMRQSIPNATISELGEIREISVLRE